MRSINSNSPNFSINCPKEIYRLLKNTKELKRRSKFFDPDCASEVAIATTADANSSVDEDLQPFMLPSSDMVGSDDGERPKSSVAGLSGGDDDDEAADDDGSDVSDAADDGSDVAFIVLNSDRMGSECVPAGNRELWVPVACLVAGCRFGSWNYGSPSGQLGLSGSLSLVTGASIVVFVEVFRGFKRGMLVWVSPPLSSVLVTGIIFRILPKWSHLAISACLCLWHGLKVRFGYLMGRDLKPNTPRIINGGRMKDYLVGDKPL